ncbi:MAG: acyl carrier protein [Eubacteriaceae bacterium]|nr:acyl carrier protein [Eubacteriaceae bacterium]
MIGQIIEIIAQQKEVDPSEITGETDFYNDLEMNSLDVVSCVADIEELSGVSIPDDKFTDIHTVNDLAELIEQLQKGK